MVTTNEVVTIVVAILCLIGAFSWFVWLLNWIDPCCEPSQKQEAKSKAIFSIIMIVCAVGWLCIIAAIFVYPLGVIV